MAAEWDNKKRLAIFTVWKRGRCELACRWAKKNWRIMAVFTHEKKAQVAIASQPLPRPPPFLVCLTVRTKINWKTTSRKDCSAVPTAAISARPDISNGWGCSSRAPVVVLLLFPPAPHFSVIKSSLGPGKALRSRRQQSTFPLLPSDRPYRGVHRQREPW